MTHVQRNAELAVREMLVKLSESHGLDQICTIHAQDYMDDGSKINLHLTINREEQTAHFDFSGLININKKSTRKRKPLSAAVC